MDFGYATSVDDIFDTPAKSHDDWTADDVEEGRPLLRVGSWSKDAPRSRRAKVLACCVATVIFGPKASLLAGAAAVAYDEEGQFAYLAASTSDCMTIVNVTNATVPSRVGSYCESATYLDRPTDLAHDAANELVYVAAYGSDRMTIVDVSRPKNPSLKGSFSHSDLDGPRGVAHDAVHTRHVLYCEEWLSWRVAPATTSEDG